MIVSVLGISVTDFNEQFCNRNKSIKLGMEKFDGSGNPPRIRGGNGKDAALSMFSKLTGGGLLCCWILLVLLLLELARFCRFISSESFKY